MKLGSLVVSTQSQPLCVVTVTVREPALAPTLKVVADNVYVQGVGFPPPLPPPLGQSPLKVTLTMPVTAPLKVMLPEAV